MLSNKEKFYLAIDRTDWKFGKTDINTLMLSAVYIAIPWEILPHQGNYQRYGSNCADILVQHNTPLLAFNISMMRCRN